ncbi:DUF2208 family protein [Caldivirga sp. UBA161]|uniref:DUF2208 family protein n=1 Tax=Caldivirga sp. UBA161 TaxID=1915569 RepID=UPI0025C424B9|nr:DUF2208 family protein [Caldivirga sp. UBA161]
MSYTMASKTMMYVLWVVTPVAFAAFFAWGQVIKNYWMPIGLFIAYFILIFGISAYAGYKSYSRNRREGDQYRRRQALSRLTGDDIRKAMERDYELPKEYSALSKKMFLNLGIMIVLLVAVLLVYSTLFNKIAEVISALLGNTTMAQSTAVFLRYFITYLIMFGIWFAVFYVVAKYTGLPYLSQNTSMMQNMPYIPTKSVAFYKDAVIFDDLYVLKAPLDADSVMVDEKRRFVEIVLKKPMSNLPYRRLRIYARDPRGIWEKYVSKYLEAQVKVEEVKRPEPEPEKPREYRCPYCGALLSEDWEYCPKCGRKIPWDELRKAYE